MTIVSFKESTLFLGKFRCWGGGGAIFDAQAANPVCIVYFDVWCRNFIQSSALFAQPICTSIFHWVRDNPDNPKKSNFSLKKKQTKSAFKLWVTWHSVVSSCLCGYLHCFSHGDGFFLACEDLGGCSIFAPRLRLFFKDFFFLKWRLGRAH